MWGDNSFGQLGSGDKIDRMSGDDAVQIVLPEGPIKTMSCGWRHTLALTRSGELYVWGHTLGYGFQGKGDMVEDETQEEHTSPVRVGLWRQSLQRKLEHQNSNTPKTPTHPKHRYHSTSRKLQIDVLRM